MGELTAVPMGEPQNGASKFEHHPH
jgi:hypothetical protein